ARRAVQRAVADLGEAPAPGALESALARALGDPELRIVYPVGDREVDADGRVVKRAPATTRTRLVRGGRTVVIVEHAGPVAALERLRELAHGIFPAVLAEAGLPAALESLADAAPLPVRIVATADERYPAAVESAAYVAVLHAVEDAAGRDAEHVWVTLARRDG